MIEIKKHSYLGNDIEYFIDYPKNFDKNKEYPVIFYIHGYGLVRKSMDFLIEKCPVNRDRIPEDLDFIIVSPLSNKDTWLCMFESLTNLIKTVIDLPYVNDKKIYLTGSSMGGYTCWLLLQTNKKLFTSAVICCGGGQYWSCKLGTFNDIPIKAVHGRLDNIVLCRESEIMAEKINQAGGNCELIIYEDLDHTVWHRIFGDKNTYYWLNRYSK